MPTHNANPRSLAALRQSTGHAHPFASYGQQSGYDKTVKLVAVRRLRIINIMIGKLSHAVFMINMKIVWICVDEWMHVCVYARIYVRACAYA